MKQLVIFDLDGTLLDTIDDLGAAANFALSTNGFPTHDLSEYKLMVGNGIRMLIRRALPAYIDPESEVFNKVFRSFVEYYNIHDRDATKPYPGIPELLSSLHALDIKLAVTSNKYQSAVTELIKHYFGEIPFAAVIGQREGVPPKPDPSVVFEALAECPTPKEMVLYIGDSGVDMETARRACVESVGVTWGFRPVDELKAAYADHIVNNPEEILDIANHPTC